MPLFSVIIPTFNRAGLVREAIASVQAQTFTDFEIVVINDGSTDGTREMLDAIGSPVRAIHQPNSGRGAARNAGIAAATGEYLTFLDDDDLWFPWTLATYAVAIDQQPSRPAILMGTGVKFATRDEFDAIAAAGGDAALVPYANYFATAYQTSVECNAGGTVVRRDLAARVGGYPAGEVFSGEDQAFVLKLADEPGFVHVVGAPTFGYRWHDHNSMHDWQGHHGGTLRLVGMLRAGEFAGGNPGNRRALMWMLSRMIRPMVFACLNAGAVGPAWQAYRKSCAIHLAARRWRFLAGFPLRLLIARVFGRRKRP